MSHVLAAIVAASRRSAFERAKHLRASVERQAASARPRPDAFHAALRQPGIRVIAECKRRSPSRGILRGDYDPAAIAAAYARAGAAAISVLTEPSFFDGDIDHLRAVREAVDLPILRKDFICTEFQVAEARAAGADAILLIVAGLEANELVGLIAHAAAYELAALIEVHTGDEARSALDAGARVIGVNSRDLRTLAVSPAVFDELAPLLPDQIRRVAESGIREPADVERLRGLGYDACLIGERFMAAPDPGEALAAFLAGVARGSVQ